MNVPYKFGDIIVRCYYKNINAICIYIDCENVNSILYLGETFDEYGGLRKFDTYSIGSDDERWYYRLATQEEVIYILNYLNTQIKIYGNIEIYSTNLANINNIDEIINIVNKFNKKIRKEKLHKLNTIKQHENT